MKHFLLATAVLLIATSCDSGLDDPIEPLPELREITYEVDGAAELAIIEYIDGEGKVIGTGIEDVPWVYSFSAEIGERLYLSAWSSETGGGALEIRVLVDGEVFRRANNSEPGTRPRISGNAY